MLLVGADIECIAGTDFHFFVPEKYACTAMENKNAVVVRVFFTSSPAARLDPEVADNELPGSVGLSDQDLAVCAPGI
jgi:hypothetical protein